MTGQALGQPCFATERLAMRPMTVGDAEALHELYRDVDAMRWWSSPPHASLADTVDYVTARLGSASWRGWVMTVKGDDTAIGTLGASETKPGVFEIGYSLVPRHAGRGYAREGVARLVELLFSDGGARRLWADIDPDNAPSRALVERLGFQLEGRLRALWETHIGVRDSVIYGLLADEWLAKG
ncbi:RimJ/RimL family protein N-acetyltransferase [Sphingomonas jinjuensis]|uniref:RimJ/RimL family protein N-acetyltransferase n=1 Tax=Sphingomonas jinjuensis TaxID=535907 RepID=A0A840FD58_9SPHN|nr:GNAT family protein [Sphingomonas jinjuensis]MBB4154572.1 RimJ/RimL family protein N-acetyltransferase [Sphingomonas jinjuensis]